MTLSTRVRAKSLVAFVNLIDELIAARAEKKLAELFERVVLKTGYEPYVRDGSAEGEDRWGNVVELQRVTSKYTERGGRRDARAISRRSRARRGH